MDNKVKRYSLSQQVADKLQSLIEKGVYSVGDKIPTEPELVSMFDVSRNTIREAIRSLTFSGLLSVKQGDGTYVSSLSSLSGSISLKCNQLPFNEINEVRDTLEIAISRFAAIRRSDEDLSIIKQKLDARQNSLSSVKENTSADVEFHIAIAKASHNNLLIELYLSIYHYLEKNIAEKNSITNLDNSKIDKMHFDLYQAIVDQDPDRAILCTRKILDI